MKVVNLLVLYVAAQQNDTVAHMQKHRDETKTWDGVKIRDGVCMLT